MNDRSGVTKFLPNGDVEVPGFVLPMSGLISPEAQGLLKLRASMPAFDTAAGDPDIAARRAQLNGYMAPQVEKLRQAHAASIEATTLGGVEVLSVTPADGSHDPDRVLINLHGGAFTVGWDAVALIESMPMAVLTKTRVVTVNYRMAPEHRHPAGVEDAAAVYAALLDDYPAERIGIYGGSAGGVLSAQLAAWLPAHGLPQAAAVGIFGAGAVPFGTGDSAYVAGYIDASFPPPPPDGSAGVDMTRGYFDGIAPQDPSAWPGYHLDVLAQFPPTLIITGTRAMDMSPAIVTNSQLLKAGVASTLIVGEAQGHCYHYGLGTPEARDAYEVIVRFFLSHLG